MLSVSTPCGQRRRSPPPRSRNQNQNRYCTSSSHRPPTSVYKWLRNWRYDWRPEKSGAITGYRTTREPPTQRTSRLGRSEKIIPNPSIRHALPPPRDCCLVEKKIGRVYDGNGSTYSKRLLVESRLVGGPASHSQNKKKRGRACDCKTRGSGGETTGPPSSIFMESAEQREVYSQQHGKGGTDWASIKT